MKTILLIIFGIISGFVFIPIPAYASCAAPPLFAAEFYNFDRAHAVFVGTVTDIYNPHPEIHTGIEEYDTITFDVLRVLKGDVEDGTVRSNHDSGGYRGFEIGKTYLVFAFAGIREVSQCTSPILLSDADAPTLLEGGYYLPFVAIGAGTIMTFVMIRRKRK
ncbi:MAG: hypothetical protein OEL81_03225 [Nitrosopumilus sp.]|nr:hypothetical protein [Nitrosopumilus sp.]